MIDSFSHIFRVRAVFFFFFFNDECHCGFILTPLMNQSFDFRNHSDAFKIVSKSQWFFLKVALILLHNLGDYEPTETECDWPSDDEDEEELSGEMKDKVIHNFAEFC